ncbi:hypothetical protein CPB83DRAFT_903339 [Crepidotus variabilis]|uniref:Uncharacterized protein n=1 Tax=Crepidotus variabilis TaxID=179855 RepID=A0A9P6EQ30_9AGAR|nr:hypothetical protein CPB83DRAFT_903339 [Crepidotus variabilis]
MGYATGTAVRVIDIWNKLQSRPDLASARIVRLSHVKNIDSPLAHEYLQFIIVTNNVRERILVERTKADQFVFNGEWKMPQGNIGIRQRLYNLIHWVRNDLPLPLFTLSWEEANAPTFYQLAQVCQAIHDQAPKYSIPKGKHCYWFAFGVYAAIKLAHGGEEKVWPFSSARGFPTFLVPRGVLDFSQLKLLAAAFQENRAKTMDYLEESGPDVIEETLKVVGLVKSALEGDGILGELEEELVSQESEPTSIIDGLDIATTEREEPFENVSPEEMYNLSNFEQGHYALKEAMKQDPAAKDNIAIYREVRNARANEGRDKSKTILHVPANDEFGYSKIVEDAEGMDMAMEAFLGAILKEIGVAQK